jgi:hypothetical protein
MKILKMLGESDLYTGMVVASSQNERHLYVLDLTIYGLGYKAIAFVNDSGVVEKYEGGSWFSSDRSDIWCETEESRKMNPASIREDRLKELGL